MIYGYARVSTTSQKIDRQLEDLKKLNIPEKNIYVDYQSGKDFNRTNYQRLIKKLKAGDDLVIKSIDRLGRNYQMITDEWKKITKDKNVNIIVIDMPILNTKNCDGTLVQTFISDLVLQILSFVAENERKNILQRQKEGIKIAKAKGIKFGRPNYPLPENFEEIVLKFKNKEINLGSALSSLSMKKSTFYKYLDAI